MRSRRELLWVCLSMCFIAGCAKDKTIPPPPQSARVDVTQPLDLSHARELLEKIPEKRGEAHNVDAYTTPAGCGEVAKFYDGYMSGAHWKGIQSGTAALPSEFTQGWKYMSRRVYLTGATPQNGAGCVVMVAVYDGSRDRYESR
jgi:hypothetical protein